jgi:lysophospholipase L1-like esterase
MKSAKKLVLIGDSITQMASNPAMFGWSAFLQDKYIRRLELENKGLSGYNSKWYKCLIGPTLQSICEGKKEIELTVLMLGSNDCVDLVAEPDSIQAVSLDEYSLNMEEMCKVIGRYSNKTILVTPPPTDRTCRPFEHVKEYKSAVLDLGIRCSIPVFDTWPLFLGKECNFDKQVLDLLLSDGLHFSYEGNKLFGEGIFEFILKTWPEMEPENLDMFPQHWSTIDNAKLPQCFD